MIHFFDPSNPKMVAKVPEIAAKVDVLLGNLEDAIQASNKEAARAGLVEVANTADLGEAQLWTRVNDLGSPWVLDDLTTLVTEAGEKIDVIMVPKVEGPDDIRYVDRLLAQLEAKARISRPIQLHAILETARGVAHGQRLSRGDRQDARGDRDRHRAKADPRSRGDRSSTPRESQGVLVGLLEVERERPDIGGHDAVPLEHQACAAQVDALDGGHRGRDGDVVARGPVDDLEVVSEVVQVAQFG